MSLRSSRSGFCSRFGSAWADARRGLWLFWYRADKGAMVLALLLGGVVMAFGIALHALYARQDEARGRVLEAERRSLACLARNVYFEARGEPVAGQYAVAEVTMNRKGSERYPGTVCGVVYEKRWDAIRKRYVGAFSWTEFDVLHEPFGEEWQRAQKVAQEVYYRRAQPALGGALYFHATHISPPWAKEKVRVARIGRHVFYR